MKKMYKRLLSLVLVAALLLPAVSLPVQAAEGGSPATDQDSLEEAYLKQYLEQINYQLNLKGEADGNTAQTQSVSGDTLQIKSIGAASLSLETKTLTVQGYNKTLPSMEIGSYDEHFENGLAIKMVPLTLSRPKGGSVQYPVSVGLRALSGSLEIHRMGIYSENYDLSKVSLMEEDALRQIVIPAGQTETTVYLYLQTGSDSNIFQGTGSFYLQFYNGHRTEVETPFVQVCLTKDALPDNITPVALESEYYGFSIPQGTEEQGVILGMPVPIVASLNSTQQLASAEGSSLTVGGKDLTPAESDALASSRLTFLYFPTEEDLETEYGLLDLASKIESLTLCDFSKNDEPVAMAGGASLPAYSIRYAKPEYGSVSLNKASYDQNETVNVTVPIKNAALLEKAKQYPLDKLSSWFALSLDGGAKLLPLSALTYSDNKIHASFAAPTTGSYCVEVIELEEEKNEQNTPTGKLIATAPYGVFQAFEVGSGVTNFVPVKSLALERLPENNRISLENAGREFALSATVSPENATFKGVTWTSSNPSVATISTTGVLIGLKTGVTTLTATVEGEVDYRAANGLEPSDVLTKSVVIYVGSVNPRLYDGSATCYNTADTASLPLNDNFDKVVPPEEAEEVYNTLRYTFSIYDATTAGGEALLYSQTDSAIGESAKNEPAYLTGNNGRALTLRFGEGTEYLKKLSSGYEKVAGRMQLQPAYRVELSAEFTHEYFKGMQPVTATYHLYVMPNGIVTSELPIEQGAIYPTGANLGTLSASFQNVPEKFTKAGYVLTRRYLQWQETPLYQAETTDVKTNDATFQFKDKVGRYDLNITPEVDYSSLPEGDYTYYFYIEDDYLGRYERTTTFSIKPLAGITKAYVDNRISGSFSVGELTKNYTEMTQNPTDTGLQKKFFSSFYGYKPVSTLRVEAPANYGNVIINGESYSGSEFLVQFPGTSGTSKLEIKWPVSSQPISLEYPYVLDEYAIVELPQRYHNEKLDVYHYPNGVETALYSNEASGKLGYRGVTPYEGKLIVRLADVTLPLKVEYRKPNGDKNTDSAMLTELAPAVYTGAPKELTISPKSSAKQESLQASGGFVTNYALMRESTRLKLAFSFDTQFSSLQIVTMDENGNTQTHESVALGNMTATKEVDYTSIIENPGWKLVVECTRYNDNIMSKELAPVLEVFDYDRLKELSGGFAQKLTTVPIHSTPGNRDVVLDSRSVKPAALYISDRNTSYFDLRNSEAYNVDTRNHAVITAVLPDSDFPGASAQEITLEGVAPNETETLSNSKLKHKYYTLRYSAAKVCAESGYSNESGLGRHYGRLRFEASGSSKTYPTNLNTHNFETVSLQWQLEDAVPKMQSIDLEDLGENTTGEADGMFNSMTIPLPETPFSFNIVKKGNEYIISGVLKVNLLPDGGFSSALSELSLESEEAFNKIYNECRKNVLDATEKDQKKSSGFNVRVGGSAFAGFTGYISARGYLNPDTGKVSIEFHEGGLIGEISAEMRQYMSLAFGEFGFKFEFSTAARMIISMPTAEELKLASNPDGMKINLELGTENKISLDARIGAGISLFFIKFTAGVGGEFSLGAETTHIQRPYMGAPKPSPGGTTVDYRSSHGAKFTGSSRLYFYTSIGILFVDFTTKYTLVEGSFDVLSPNLSTNPYHKDYPFKKEKSNLRFAPSARLMAISADKVQKGTKLVDGLLQSSGAGYYGNGLPVYVKPDADYNNYALHTGSNTLGTDGKGKFAFDSATNGNNTVLAWEQIDEEIKVDEVDDPNAALLDYMGKTEIYASVWNGTNWTAAQQLSDNMLMDMTPKTAVNASGNGIVVWNRGTAEQTEKGRNAEAQDAAPDLKATSELVFARYSSTSWGDGKMVVQIPANAQLVDYSVAMNDAGDVLIAAALQKTSGLCDIEYYYIAAADDSISIFEDANQGLSPQVLADADGFHVAYYGEQGQERQGTIYYGGFDTKTSAVTAPVTIDGPLSQNLKLVSATDGPVLVWSVMTAGMDGKGAQNGLYAAKLVSRTEKLDDKTTRSFTTATQPQLLGAAPYAIPSFDAWTDGNEVYANALLAELEIDQPGAALYKFETEFINEIGVSADFNYELLQPDTDLPITFTVRNEGYLPITSIDITSAGLNFTKAESLDLQPGASIDLIAYHTLPKDKITDLDTTVTATFSNADSAIKEGAVYLKVTDLSVKLLGGDENELTLSALNRSGFALPTNTSVTLGLYRDANGMVPIGAPIILEEKDIETLNEGGSVQKTVGSLPTEENAAVFGLITSKAASGEFLWELNPSDNVESTVLNPVYKEKNESSGGGGSSRPSLSISTARFDKNPVSGEHKSLTVLLNGIGNRTLSRILFGGKVLEQGADYSATATAVTLQKSFMETLPLGKQELVFEFSDGEKLALEVVVSDTRENPFADVSKDDWFYEDVCYAYQNGLFFGTSDTSFSPKEPMTRAMLVTVLYRSAGAPEPEKDSGFTDVAQNAWYAKAVPWAVENQIVEGYGGGLFGPNDPVTREQLTSILYRMAKSPSVTSALERFVDAGQVSGFAKDAISWAVQQKIIFGKGGDVLDPKGSASRAEVAAMLKRFLQA